MEPILASRAATVVRLRTQDMARPVALGQVVLPGRVEQRRGPTTSESVTRIGTDQDYV